MHEECLVTKFFHFFHTIIENYEDLKLSDEEMKKIRDLKIKTKKELIRDKAEVDVLALDILVRIWDERPDSAEINKLVEKKFDVKKESTKKLLEAFVTVKKMLSREQMKMVKAICKSDRAGQEKEPSCCKG